MRKNKILQIILTIVCILLIIGLSTILHPCLKENMNKCKMSVLITQILFGITGIMSLIPIFLKEKGYKIMTLISTITSTLCVLGSFLTINVFVGGCKVPEMACRAVSFPSIYIASLIAIIINVILIIITFRKEKDELND